MKLNRMLITECIDNFVIISLLSAGEIVSVNESAQKLEIIGQTDVLHVEN